MPTPDEIALEKSIDAEIERIEDLMKHQEEEEAEYDEEFLKSRGRDDDDDDDDEDDEYDDDDDEDDDDDDDDEYDDDDDDDDDEYDDDDDDDDDMVEKSYIDENDEMYYDATEIVKSIRDENRGLSRRVRFMEKSFRKQSELILRMAKSLSDINKSLSQPSGYLKGYSPSLYKSANNATSTSEIKHLLLKGLKEGKLDRSSLVKFEQAGQLTQEAKSYLKDEVR